MHENLNSKIFCYYKCQLNSIKFILFGFVLVFSNQTLSAPDPSSTQIPNSNTASLTPSAPPSIDKNSTESIEEELEGGGNAVKLLNGLPSKRRIRRVLSLVQGIKHDEELLLPEIPLTVKGNVELLEMQRIKDSDIFRITPLKVDNGIITIHNKKTGQILVELRIDIRDQRVDKMLREIQALLADIEGIEYKIVNGKILLDGFVLLPKDLKRIGAVIGQFSNGQESPIQSLVTLSPIAKKKIVEYIARDINNPEITVTSVGDFIKLEGFVNSEPEKQRITDIVLLYLPDIVTDKGQENLKNLTLSDRKPPNSVDSYVINLIQVRATEQKPQPPPKMIQFVLHVVEYSERYFKNFNFLFSPSLSSLGAAQQQSQVKAPGSISELASIVDNLLPKLNWARNHGYIRLLDTASILTQDKSSASISRSINVSNGQTSLSSQAANSNPSYDLTFNVSDPTIKAERTGLIEMSLDVSSKASGLAMAPSTNVKTKISVVDRQSAALAGVITKKSENKFGGPTGAGAVVTLNHGKEFSKSTSNFVLFVTPIIKSSASAGVDQIKKKFRLKE